MSVALHALVIGTLLVGDFVRPADAPPRATPTVIDLELVSPPTPVEDVPPGPQQVERRAAQPVAPEPPPARLTPAVAGEIPRQPPQQTSPTPPGSPASETTAPQAQPAPAAARAASNVVAAWEGQVLAALEKRRRYPPAAQSRRQQGVVFVRFRMDREGRVLWSRLERSSGFGELDRAAVATPGRAQPLPRIPVDRPDEVELVVPVEFFISPR